MKGLFGRAALGACLAVLMLGLFVVPAPVPAEAKVLPPGSYRNSCKDCYVDNGWLYCRCKNGRDGRNDTRIHYTRCNGDIANVDGWLTCGGQGGGGYHRMPGGSWRDSCRNGRVQGNELTAECRNGNGKWVQSWISLNKCPGNLSNMDGRLVCEGQGRQWKMPGGSWRGSCRKARIEGDTLWAECRAKNGDWRGSRVNLQGCGNVNNCNGRLHCGPCQQPNQTIR
ncbi:MAG: CVNH domain-containing protein [Desulfarculus sp.]|nr:CVNH domain-containing protein [Pseudomonadota bacterium]MBV1716245.1 CVNH domain-containing protein [Desulfarculus sp.]MBU4574373.1 CVNH domain-containing protein [Pseudomonadota bacterium]MBU4599409.1 CVNH domain-containing protein [Pseudomonadota bacterium]MBV1737676.1 CVNH domain-containing protein [Desulfarculus sp.]